MTWNWIEKLIIKIMEIILRIFHIEWQDSQWNSFIQFVKFGIVGVSNTVISYIINVVVLLLLSHANVSWDYIVANLIAFFLSVLWSFYWNNRFVFCLEEGKKRSIGKALVKTYISYSITGVLLFNMMSWLWITAFHISKFIAPLINLIVSVPLNFIMNKLWAFKME